MSSKVILITILAVLAFSGAVWSLLHHEEGRAPAQTSTASSTTEQTPPATETNVSSVQSGFEAYTNEDNHLEFQYKNGDDGYVLVPSPEFGPLALSLYKTAVWNAFVAAAPQNTEGPPGISITVFPNTDQEAASEWIMRGDRSNYDRSTPYTTVKISGYDGVRYQVQGLYNMDYAVVTTSARIYVFSASYDASDDPIRADFSDLLATVKILK